MNHAKKQKCGKNYHFRIRLHLALRTLQEDNLKRTIHYKIIRMLSFTNGNITKAQNLTFMFFASQLLGQFKKLQENQRRKSQVKLTRSNMSTILFSVMYLPSILRKSSKYVLLSTWYSCRLILEYVLVTGFFLRTRK